MPDFHSHMKSVISKTGVPLTELSQRIGKGKNYLSNMFQSEQDPSTSVIMGIAAELNTSLDELVGLPEGLSVQKDIIGADVAVKTSVEAVSGYLDRSSKRLRKYGLAPTIEELTDWWWKHGGRLTNIDQFQEFFDFYHAPKPESDRIASFRMGSNSASASTYNLKNTRELNEVLKNLNRPLSRDLANAQRKTLEKNKPEIDMENIDIPTPTGIVNVAYRRLYLPIDVNTERPLILNYSQRLSITKLDYVPRTSRSG